MQAIITDNLSKQYTGNKNAVDHISLTLDQGEVFGFLGPNGAGKTTTVKLLNGMLTPTEGSCEILGRNPSQTPEAVHTLSGVVTEHAQMYNNLTGFENIIFYGSIFGVSKNESKLREAALLNQLDLAEAKNQKLSTYSTGMRQRLSLARALMHHPSVLFLDEPTSGLDPESAQKVNQLIRNLAKENGITVFLCTHQLRYAQEICTRYGLIEEGKLLALGTLEQLRSNITSDITVCIQSNFFPEWIPHRQVGRQNFEVTIQSEEEIPLLIKQLVEAGSHLYQVVAKHPSLEDIYFALTQKEAKQ